jgi:hypothetical protein
VQEALRALEAELVDERVVQAWKAFAAPEHATEVGLVLQDELDDGGLPTRGWRRCLLVGELPRDRGRAEPAGRVQLEDALDGWRRALVRHYFVAFVAAVAERESPRRPSAFFRAALDAGGDAVDHSGVLELGEDAEHLQHHPARGGAGVERLGRRPQHDAEPVELLGKLGELAHLAREAIDAVDEQKIDRVLAREFERLCEPGSVELRSG